jgi:murein DD-endopeptidase MepM/ murein hydrolase activator NlpD
MSGGRGIAAVLAVAAATAVAASASGETGASRPASAAAQAFARQDGAGRRVGHVSVEGDGDKSGGGTRAAASTGRGRASASATASVTDVDIFDGLVSAREVRVRAGADGDGTTTSGSVAGLAIEGRAVPSPAGRTRYDLNGYGRLVALGSGSTGILGLRATLTKEYKGHGAGEVVKVAYASARASDAVRAAARPEPAPRARAKAEAKSKPKASRKKRRARAKRDDHRGLSPRHKREAADLLATLGYTFPVVGDHTFSDDWGAARQDTGWHQGNDVFAAFGTPIIAIADGRLYRVGTRKVPGNRLWLRDRKGHTFFYAHLSDFAAAAYNGADVHAGEVIGFVGSTGDAEQTPPHLHFEVHLADGTPIDPFDFLTSWEKNGAGTDKWVRRYGEDPGVRPGALVVVKDFLAEP